MVTFSLCTRFAELRSSRHRASLTNTKERRRESWPAVYPAFVTLHSTEVIASTGNTNISRSILFGSVPFTHTGVRGSWALNDQVSFYAGLNNGWDQLTDSNKPKTVELGASLNPIRPLTLMVSDYYGKENVPTLGTPSANSRKRNSLNAVAS